MILKGGRHLLELINEVLDIARIESGELRMSPEPVMVGDVLQTALDLIRPLAVQASISLVAPGPDEPVERFVLADRQRLRQILLNLLSNAVKYNRVAGTVTVSCEDVGPDRIRLLVTDTGPGIRPEQRDLLFEPFERLGAEHTAVEGTGIGLALAHRLAHAMDGSLDVTSRPGEGSTFWVELPVVEGERPRPVETRPRRRDDQADRPRRIVLHIEDNPSNTLLMERILQQRSDVELVAAAQGRLGLELAREHRPALVLLDLHLPDIGGDTVLGQLRADPSTAQIPVIMVSADATAGQAQRLLAAGATAFLTKPVDVNELMRCLDMVLVP
jgi:CheY-like chemotaxis protein/anti-sigma regulatory factor (Ser/Thr protein kinase)